MPPSHPADVRLDPSLLRGWPLPANEDGDKHQRGTVLVIGGSEGTPGAVLLAGTAALRMGAGRLQIATTPSVTTALALAVPEALVVPMEATGGGPLVELVAAADAVVIGPGLDDLDNAAELVALVLDHAQAEAVVVVYAFGIAALAPNASRVALRPNRLIITPNREELDGLDGGDDADRRERVVAERYGLTVVSFGCVAAGDGRVWVDPVTVTGLGTSGSGDVLAGAAGGAGAGATTLRRRPVGRRSAIAPRRVAFPSRLPRWATSPGSSPTRSHRRWPNWRRSHPTPADHLRAAGQSVGGYACARRQRARWTALATAALAASSTFSGGSSRSLKSTLPMASPTQYTAPLGARLNPTSLSPWNTLAVTRGHRPRCLPRREARPGPSRSAGHRLASR